MNIGFSIRTFHAQSGGLQAHAAALARELLRQGHSARVLTRALERHQRYQDFFRFMEPKGLHRCGDIPVHLLARSRFWNPALWMISKCVARDRWQGLPPLMINRLLLRQARNALDGCDLVHHVGHAHELIGFVAARAARDRQRPFVVQPTIHPGQWGDSAFDLRLYRQADALFVHSNHEKEHLASLGVPGPFHVVGNGIADRTDGQAGRFRQRHGIQGPLILFLGRKTRDKGFPLLQDAYRILRRQREDATLVLLGPEGKPATARQDGILDLGFSDEQTKHDALAACDLLCVPSEGESFGLVYMEAGLYGKPSVARNLPVLQELLGRHDAIRLTGPAKGPPTMEELSQAILHLLDHPAEARAMGEKARQIARGFVWQKAIQRFLRAYEDVLAGNCQSAGQLLETDVSR